MFGTNHSKFLLSAGLLLSLAVNSQLPEYYVHMLTAQQGLNATHIISLTKDKGDFLWLASQGSIQRYDGKSTKRFELNETIEKVFCDNQNRKWCITRRAVYLFKNDHEGFTEVKHSTEKNIICLFNDGKDLLMLTSAGIEIFNESQFCFIATSLLKNRINKPISGLFSISPQSVFFCTPDSIYRLDKRSKSIQAIRFTGTFMLTALDETELLVTDFNANTFHHSFNGLQPIQLRPIEIPAFRKVRFIRVFEATLLDNNRYLVATTCGLLYYDKCTKKFSVPIIYHRGSELIINNSSTRTLYRDNYGTIYMTSPEGISFFSPVEKQIHFLKTYRWGSETLPDTDIRGFDEDDKGKIWLATSNGLSSLDMMSGQIETFYPGESINNLNNPSIRNILFYKEKLWIGTGGKGVWLFNSTSKKFTRPNFNNDSSGKKTEELLNDEYIWKLAVLQNGNILVAGTIRSYTIDHITQTVSLIKTNHPMGASRSAIIDSLGRIWHGSTKGLKCYDQQFNLLFSIYDSFPDKRIAAITEIDKNNFLIGSRGLYLVNIAGNKPTVFKRIETFPKNRFVFSMQKDKNGNIWIGTDEGLYQYNTSSGEMTVLDASDNIQPQAFNSNGLFLSRKGVLFAGGRSGFNYFEPGKFSKKPVTLSPTISSVSIGGNDSVFFTSSGPYRTDFFNRSLLITISSPEYIRPHAVQYRFKLNENEEWISNGNNNVVRLFNLKPGSYSFSASVSLDGKNWSDCEGLFDFAINKPWWQQLWFRSLCFALVLGVVFLIKRYRTYKRRKQESQRTIEYFANSGHAHSTVEDIVWDIALNCISRLDLQDCVIYLLDDERNMLIQKAACGAKSQKKFEIINPIEIPVGKGIVGHVAKNGIAEIVNDTSKDKRYIIDNEARFSEIAVPIIYNGRVIGVIDSEHKKKNYFKKSHLELFHAIATISAEKISKGFVMERMMNAKDELTELGIKMLEIKFMNLRLQMNPHFLFNSLSSIQHLVVTNQTQEAYKYLTIFSQFIRSILKYADKIFITLEEEIQMLESYIKLEALGFDQTFRYNIAIDETLDTEDIRVPPLMIQPLVENAIWHGLAHKEGEKYFSLKILGDGNDNLICIVEDNGVGRKRAEAIQSGGLHASVHESKATGLLNERLEILTRKTSKTASVFYEDKYENNCPAGTKVQLILPFYNTVEI